VDVRRERKLINKHLNRHSTKIGLTLTWFEFLKFGEGSEYDQIYDTGGFGESGRTYKPGIVIPILHMDEIEDESRAINDGRQPTSNIVVKMSMDDMIKAGISNPWDYEPRLNDIFYHDDRYFSVYRYRVRGKLKGEVIVMVQGVETFPEQELVFDNSPEQSLQTLPWPPSLPDSSV
jgi:hypothetical protein